MPKKKDKFYITKSYNSLKSHKKGAQMRLIP